MQMTIYEAIDGIYNCMLDYGLKKATAMNYRFQYFYPVRKFYEKNNASDYSQMLTFKFLEWKRTQLKDGLITENHFKTMESFVLKLNQYATTGCVDFSKKNHKSYIPSEYHQNLVNKMNESTAPASRQEDAIIRHFFCFVEEKSIIDSDITDQTMFDFLDEVKDTNKGSMRIVLTALSKVSALLKELGNTSLKVDFKKIQVKGHRKRIIEPYSSNEVKSVLDEIASGRLNGTRDKAIILLAYDTGLRAVDICGLTFSDIDWKAKEIRLIQSKTDIQLEIPVHDTVLNAVADYILNERPKSEAREIFLRSKSPYTRLNGSGSLDGIIQRACTRAGVEKKERRSFHSLRRSFAVDLSNNGVPLPTVSQMLGHKDINSDRPYLSYDREKTLFCARDFSEVPIRKGAYAGLFQPNSEGGDEGC
ncbi:MAG: site-specific integrase [Clostridiales bacterium]|nr:site-specific integrase [Clostridiales bacterium]